VSALLLLGSPHHVMAFVLITLLGGLAGRYSIASATNDWIEPQVVNGILADDQPLWPRCRGRPVVAAGSMIVFGPKGFLWSLVGLHGMVALFFFYRMVAWRSRSPRGRGARCRCRHGVLRAGHDHRRARRGRRRRSS
jgi:hypothetical protein